MAAIGSGVRIPATTSSPWASMRNSPKKTFSPVEGSRVKQTPVPEVVPRLPKTMDWTLTAVPSRPSMRWMRRYLRALSHSQERKTASTAWRSCSTASSGKSSPVSSRKIPR